MSERKRTVVLAAGIPEGDTRHLSMGAQIADTSCTLCGRVGEHVHKGDVVIEDGKAIYPVDSRPQFFMFSMVEAPKCEECREPMRYLKRGTDWECPNAMCLAFQKPVNTGVGGIID